MALVADEAVDEPIVAAFLVKYPGYRLFVEDLEELVRNEKGPSSVMMRFASYLQAMWRRLECILRRSASSAIRF